MKLAKEEVAKRIATATNKTSKKKAPSETAITASSSTSQEKDKEFRIGDFCRSTYEDGIDYEAQIISKDQLTNKFLIKYIGYNNEELVTSADLLPSWGKKHRKQQKVAAELERAVPEARVASTKGAKMPTLQKLDPKVVFPPPPPMPPILDDDMQDAEHLSAMLMSWYMSGYYTGLYQGQKMGRRQN